MAPKPPKSAFVHFQLAKRDEIMGSRPGMTYNEYAQEIGRLWRGMTDEDKQAWKELADEDKLRYNAEMTNYKMPAYASDSDSDTVSWNVALLYKFLCWVSSFVGQVSEEMQIYQGPQRLRISFCSTRSVIRL